MVSDHHCGDERDRFLFSVSWLHARLRRWRHFTRRVGPRDLCPLPATPGRPLALDLCHRRDDRALSQCLCRHRHGLSQNTCTARPGSHTDRTALSIRAVRCAGAFCSSHDYRDHPVPHRTTFRRGELTSPGGTADPTFGQRNLTRASVVSRGRSSVIQWPVSCNTTTVTSVATSFICAASSFPNDFSPPIESTGTVSFVCESCAKSFASCGHDAK